MSMRLTSRFWASLLGLILVLPANADMIEFSFREDDIGAQSGTVFMQNLSNQSADGVSFDVRLTVGGFDADGDADNLNNNGSRGFGVTGGSNLVNDFESLSFELDVLNEVGGSVSFDGFSQIEFSSLDEDELAVFSSDNDSSTSFFSSAGTGSTFDQVNLQSLPESFFVFASVGTFRVDTLTANFTGTPTPIPDPSSLALAAVGGIGGAIRYRRRRRLRSAK